jgi:hypothetical protein
MPARLLPLIEGTAPTIHLQRPVIFIGRHPECDVRLDVPQVSRRHCCVALAYNRLIIRDLGSRNGVRVNGRLIDEIQLQNGDEVAIAQVIYRFEEAPAPAPAPPPPASKPVPEPGVGPSRPLLDVDDLVPLDIDDL